MAAIVIILTVLFAVGGLAILFVVLSLLHGALSSTAIHWPHEIGMPDGGRGFDVVTKSPSPSPSPIGTQGEASPALTQPSPSRRSGHVAGWFKVDADG